MEAFRVVSKADSVHVCIEDAQCGVAFQICFVTYEFVVAGEVCDGGLSGFGCWYFVVSLIVVVMVGFVCVCWGGLCLLSRLTGLV